MTSYTGMRIVQRLFDDLRFQCVQTITRMSEAKSYELRSSMCLARLWHSQNKTTEAHDLLAPIYGWFTEGFDR